ISLSKGHTIISIRDEIAHCESYMKIQRIRYKNRFAFRTEIDPEILDYSTVKLVLQPLLENAIYYGVGDMDEDDGGEIRVTGRLERDTISLTVSDNGNGMTKEELEHLLESGEKVPKHGSGVGVINVHNRIQLLFGPSYGITAESEPDEGTSVTIHLPAVFFTPEKGQEMESQMKVRGNSEG
ncbi:MAG: sensor histidine kinase, partial [Lachnospiraceae bacterium]|nr:sensor histidine kinase [Lachnospiraceae bacterium]